ncbi:Sphingomyelin phosphodiesterase 2, neutral membrane (Neutral sphingomyelinase) [Blomia tropicalis]|nr:Sphingomyelin phosphodiesterase 2, neutral membrane (Neutral sphingomyelinase) [Blomia tropicalis]
MCKLEKVQIMINVSLKILCLNCYGLKWISPNRAERIAWIGEYIIDNEYDIVCLQEIFVRKDYEYLSSRLRQQLPYCHWYTNSGLVGSSGLATFSNIPIESVHFHQFRLQGTPLKPYHGDWYARKGIGYARLCLQQQHQQPSSLIIHLFNQHLLANYGGEQYGDQYGAHRACQAYEIARYVETICSTIDSDNSILILAGDFNMLDNELGYRMICSRLGLYDCHHCSSECSCYTLDPSSKVSCPREEKIDYILIQMNKKLIDKIETIDDNGLGPSAQTQSIANQFNWKETNLECIEELSRLLLTYLHKTYYRNINQVTLVNLSSLSLTGMSIFNHLFETRMEKAAICILFWSISCTLSLLAIRMNDSEKKAINYMLSCIQLDFSRFRTIKR